MCKNTYVSKFYWVDFFNHINPINSTEMMFKNCAYGKFFINPINLINFTEFINFIGFIDFT